MATSEGEPIIILERTGEASDISRTVSFPFPSPRLFSAHPFCSPLFISAPLFFCQKIPSEVEEPMQLSPIFFGAATFVSFSSSSRLSKSRSNQPISFFSIFFLEQGIVIQPYRGNRRQRRRDCYICLSKRNQCHRHFSFLHVCSLFLVFFIVL
jgi:hypothetical protein